jgi:hypothetical protein
VGYQNCLDACARANGWLNQDDDFKICEAERQKELADMHVGPWMIWRDELWRHFGWHLVRIVPVVLLVPPLIEYGIIRFIVKAALWIANGFRAPQSST